MYDRIFLCESGYSYAAFLKDPQMRLMIFVYLELNL